MIVDRTPGKSTSFDYDALGRPVIKRSGSVSGSGHVIRVTLYDGGTVLADLDSAGNREAEYVYDEGTDRPYAILTGSTAVTGENFYVQNDMGNVDGLFKDTSHITETVTYGDWGLPITWGDTTNRFTWKGLNYDPDVGLTYMRSRWYDPNIGRFVSEDPLGLGGGINPYVYANDDPINGFDPSGATAYISTDNNRCQYSYTEGDSDLYFEIGGCDFGGGDPLTGFDPFANDSPLGHSDEPPQGDPTSGATGPTSAKPTPQQVFTAVGKTVAPFNNAMNHGMDCAERSGELAVGLTGDASLAKIGARIFSKIAIATLEIRAIIVDAASLVVEHSSVSSSVAVDGAAAKEFGHEYVAGAATTGGFNFAHGENPLLSYVPIYGSFRYALPAAYHACASGSSE